ncbi:hypothetical protein F511_14425 [Dorcoceras hygrometricum]|uniref:Transcription factor HY5 n=1 Tax=Dorcoceras hygrometricum TaxID=472368 RepID=A0A2Z7CSC3_9LAMI|nr:hypothetical protein F511_14425 [Dorcoceras hygrometricum]
MAGLKRSARSFRRQGSSGLVWDDDELAAGFYQFVQTEGKLGELRHCHSLGGDSCGATPADQGSLKAAPHVYSRSVSAPITNPRLPKFVRKVLFAGFFGKPPKSGEHANEGREMQEQATSSIAANSLPSSSERSSSSALNVEVKEGMESDDEIRRVPEMGGEAAGLMASGGGSVGGPVQQSTSGSRRRGRSPADKENKRLKRLLRNRVSAQQARERKKAYLIDLEGRVKELETKNAELEERLSTLQNENQMLRQVNFDLVF